jgi:hypothetical protein
MQSNSWKKKSRSGGVRRKVLKEYSSIIKSDTDQSTTNNTEGDQSATVHISEAGSVHNKYNVSSGINVEAEKCENQPRCSSSEDHANATAHLFEVGSVHDKNYNNVSTCSTLDDENNFIPASSSSAESDTNSDFDMCNKQLVFCKKIRIWAVENKITHIALNDLIAIINEFIPQILSKDARTILAVPRNINIKLIEGGEYWHHGIADPLKTILEKWNDVPESISLNFNFDGLPIFKSSKHEFWPILCNIFENQKISPFVIGIYFGVGKPKDLAAYLDDFVNEMKILLEEGIKIGQSEQAIKIKVRCIICDSPARAYIKGKDYIHFSRIFLI